MSLFDTLIGFGTPTFNGSPLPGSGGSGSGGSQSGGFSSSDLISSLLGFGGSLVTGLLGNKASNTQANAALQAATQANALQKYIYDNNLAVSAPWLNQGGAAVNRLGYLLGLGNPPSTTAQVPGAQTPATGGSIRGALPAGHDSGIVGPWVGGSAVAPGAAIPWNAMQKVAVRQKEGEGKLPKDTSNNFQLLDQLGDGPIQPPYTVYDSGSGAVPLFDAGGRPNELATGDAGHSPSNNADFGSLMHDFGLQDFQVDPGYLFRLQEGQKALERSAASRGNLFSGGTQKALSRYNQDFASNEFSNAFNRFQANRGTKYSFLSGLAGLGQGSANQVQAAGQNYANNVNANSINAANTAAQARASGYATTANAVNSGINNLQQLLLLRRLGI